MMLSKDKNFSFKEASISGISLGYFIIFNVCQCMHIFPKQVISKAKLCFMTLLFSLDLILVLTKNRFFHICYANEHYHIWICKLVIDRLAPAAVTTVLVQEVPLLVQKKAESILWHNVDEKLWRNNIVLRKTFEQFSTWIQTTEAVPF